MSSSVEPPVVLIRNSKPAAKVLTRTGAPAAEQFAAEEIIRHLCTMAGRSPAIGRSYGRRAGATTVHVNDRDAAEAAGITIPDLDPEQFHIQTCDGNVHLLGGGHRGVLYAAYELLERLGCRWYAPDEDFIPRLRRAELPSTCVTDGPAFEFRDNSNTDTGDPLWRVRNRMNGQFPSVPDYLGGQVRYGMFVHTFDRLVPPLEFFDEHPEYFSFIDGARRRDRTQLCLTNPDVLALVTRRVLEHMRRMPDATIFSVSQNDWNNYCQCPQCTAVAQEEGSQAGPMIRFVNAVAAETSKHFPDNLIDTLAYTYTLDAPRRATPGPNVRVRLCSIRCCQAHGYGTCDHPESQRFLTALEGWSRLTDRIYIWHYCTDFHHYLTPMPNLDELHANINLYRRLGVCGVFMQGGCESGGGDEASGLRGYLISKLLWNPDRPAWPIVEEFLSAYYGKAAGQVRQYLDFFHNRVREDRTLHPSCFDPPGQRLFEGDILARAGAALAEGERRTRGRQRRRVHMLKHGITYTRLYRTIGEFKLEGDIYRCPAKAEDLAECETMFRELKRTGFEHVEERFDIDTSVHKLRNRLLAHPVRWLRDGQNEIAVVPNMGGRLIRWNTLGRQWLALPKPAQVWPTYPMQNGYYEQASFMVYSNVGWAEAYRPGRSDETSLTLTARLERDIRVRRTYRLRDGALHVDSRLMNAGSAEIKVGWGAYLHLCLPGPASVRFTPAGADETVLTWENMSDRISLLESDRLPNGVWQATGDGFVVIHRFACERISSCLVGSREPTEHTLDLDLHTDLLRLGPGQEIRVRQEITIQST